MSGGARHWNEETQRWEDADSPSPATPATSPPPAPPEFAPAPPRTGDTGDTGGPADGAPGPGPAGPGAAGSGPAAEWWSSGTSTPSGTASTWPPAAGAQTGGSPDAGTPSAWPPQEGTPAGRPPAAGTPASWPPDAGTQAIRTPDAGTPAAWHSDTVMSPTGPPGANAPTWPHMQWPPPADQPGTPVPAKGLSRKVVWSVLVGAAAVGVAVSLLLTLVVGKDDGKGGKPAAAGSSAASSASPSPEPGVSEFASPSDEASPTPTGPELPAGYVTYQDDEGFVIAAPEGWTRSAVASQYGIDVVSYRSPDNTHRLQVYQVAESSPDASFKLYLSDQTPKPDGFRKLSLENLDSASFTGSRLEYVAGSLKGEPDVGTWHVYDERFVAADGNIYAIAAYGPQSDGRSDELKLLTTALDWFCPPDMTCDPASVD